jgi:hypothetical protein
MPTHNGEGGKSSNTNGKYVTHNVRVRSVRLHLRAEPEDLLRNRR